MNLRKFQTVGAFLLILLGSAFLMKMCYLSLVFNCFFGVGFLTAVYLYCRTRHDLTIPFPLLALVFVALQVDALGNYFRMYGQRFGPMQYDEFAHLTVQVLASPLIVWLMHYALARWGYHLPLKLTAFFSATTMFSISAAYEIIELWDELYAGGKRIWGLYDTATDLQWDLCGIILGTVLACCVLRSSEIERKILPATLQA